MEVLRYDPDHPDEAVLLAAAETVLRGGLIAFPTDTLYGLGCSLFDVSAVEMVARLKRRDPSLAFISLIPDAAQVYGLASEVTEVAERLMAIGRATAPFLEDLPESTRIGDLLYDERGLPR